MLVHPERDPNTFVGAPEQVTGPKIVQGTGATPQRLTKVQPELQQALTSTQTGKDSKPIDKTKVTVKTGAAEGTEAAEETEIEYTELTKEIKNILANATDSNLDSLLEGETGEYKGHLKREEDAFVEQFKASSDTKINEKNKDGTTPLMVAVQNRLLGVVQALVDAGANVNLKNKEGISTLQLAQSMQNTKKAEDQTLSLEIANILFQAGATESGEEAPLPTEAETVNLFKTVLEPTKKPKPKGTGGYNSLGG